MNARRRGKLKAAVAASLVVWAMHGIAPTGFGFHGIAPTGFGLHGIAPTGFGLHGIALTGFGWHAIAAGQPAAAAVIDDAADLNTQQAQEKQELEEMKREMGDIKSIMKDAQQSMDTVARQHAAPGSTAGVQEVHLIAREAPCEVAPGISGLQLTYNGQQPGPVIRVQEGQPLRVVLHNQMRVPTSLCFHGMLLPQAIAGLPRHDAGLVAPGKTYAFQFVAPAPGTYWYHPQVMHADQMARGLYGAIVVEPASAQKTYDRDVVLVLGKDIIVGRTFFTVNGKTAPAIPPIEVKSGERVRLRVINVTETACPLYLTGHRFEVVSANGADPLEPHVSRDTLTLQPGDRYDLEFTANNPGVWSLASVLPGQTTTDGKFPGGIAVVVRYPEVLKPAP